MEASSVASPDLSLQLHISLPRSAPPPGSGRGGGGGRGAVGGGGRGPVEARSPRRGAPSSSGNLTELNVPPERSMSRAPPRHRHRHRHWGKKRRREKKASWWSSARGALFRPHPLYELCDKQDSDFTKMKGGGGGEPGRLAGGGGVDQAFLV
ncbi:hypothetical protein ABZP36_026160 [Zizania latifolia]